MESKLGNAYYTDQTTITAGGYSSSGTSDTKQGDVWDPAIRPQWKKWIEIV